MVIILFPDIFKLMGKIHDKAAFDESCRLKAIEILVLIFEMDITLLKDLSKVKILIKQIFKYALEIEQEITNEWLFPKTESYSEEEVIEEEKVRNSMSFLDRIVIVSESDIILPIISESIITLLINKGGWKYKYLALLAIAQISKNIDNLNHVEPILDVNNNTYNTYNI